MTNPADNLDASTSEIVTPPWSVATRIAFRFAFSFWTIFCLDTGITNFLLWFWPWLDHQIGDILDWPLTQLNLWMGRHVFHLTGLAAAFHPNGSGDVALNWVRALELLFLATVIGAIWTGISESRKRRFEYRTLHQWLRLGLRFRLASMLFSYGFYKIFPLQFPPATPEQLSVTYADSSPMGLLWRFMGASPLYSFFGGLAEVVPGLLLLFRRTATLGALAAAAVMLNVVALNFSYDVPVKLHSTEWLLMAIFLIVPDLRPIFAFFVRNEDAHLSRSRVPSPERRALRIAAIALQVITICWLLYDNGLGAWRTWYGNQTPLAGSWKVEGAGEALAAEGWTSLSTSGKDALQVSRGGQLQIRRVRIDTVTQTVQILGDWNDQSASGNAPAPSGVFHWSQENQGFVRLAGTWQGRPATLLLHRTLPNSKLETRGFHLIQEANFNR